VYDMGKFKTIFKKFLGFEEDFEIDHVNIEDELQKQKAYYGSSFEEEQVEPKEIQEDPVKAQINRPKPASYPTREHIEIYPKTFEDACEAVDYIATGKVVTINMDDLSIEVSKRIADFVLGATYVLQGDVEKLSGKVFRFWIEQ
jgi:cell division inhibitor SepF